MNERLTRREFLWALFALGASACAPKIPEPTPRPKVELPGISDLDFPISGDMYLLNGPHDIIHGTDRVRSGIDLFSPDKNAKIIAAHYGKVVYADEFLPDGNINNTLHSIVEIDVGDGYSLQYVHVGKVRVKAGDTVHRGDILGEQSMEIPGRYFNEELKKWIEPKSDKIHLHFGIKRYGKAIEIDGVSIAGWKIRKGPNLGDGTMSKEDKYAVDNYTVYANSLYLCGPSLESRGPCQGRMNFIPYPIRLRNR